MINAKSDLIEWLDSRIKQIEECLKENEKDSEFWQARLKEALLFKERLKF